MSEGRGGRREGSTRRSLDGCDEVESDGDGSLAPGRFPLASSSSPPPRCHLLTSFLLAPPFPCASATAVTMWLVFRSRRKEHSRAWLRQWVWSRESVVVVWASSALLPFFCRRRQRRRSPSLSPPRTPSQPLWPETVTQNVTRELQERRAEIKKRGKRDRRERIEGTGER